MTTRVRRQKSRKARRKSFLIDHPTLLDLNLIQVAQRATSTSEATRIAIRKMAELIRYVDTGKVVHVMDPKRVEESIVLDIPTSEVQNG